MTTKEAKKEAVRYINPKGLANNPAFTQAISVSSNVRTLYIGAQLATNAKGEIVGKGDIKAQTEQTLKNVDACLAAEGADKSNIITMNVYVLAGQSIPDGFAAFQEWWGKTANPPANTVLFVAGMALPDTLVAIDAVAVIPED